MYVSGEIRGAISAAALIGLAACGGRGGEARNCQAPARISAASGFCVPRYLSLKRGEVFARKGPGADYPALWVYRAQGLPVQVVEETLDWRRVCDPDGAASWVHRSMLDGRRMVMTMGAVPVALRSAPRADARIAAMINGRALAALDRCAGDWCKVRVGAVSGWAAASSVWGSAPARQCR
ncbi:MAG TPA: SH3 domain-containing protein [Caulobacteraceae bacterium]